MRDLHAMEIEMVSGSGWFADRLRNAVYDRVVRGGSPTSSRGGGTFTRVAPTQAGTATIHYYPGTRGFDRVFPQTVLLGVARFRRGAPIASVIT